MSASRMPALSPIACRPSAMLTAVVDLPTPPLPEATAIMCLMPAICAMGPRPPGAAAGPGGGPAAAAALARASRTLALSGGSPGRAPPPLPALPCALPGAPRGFSAVSTAITLVTPSRSRTIFSAAWRSGSSSAALSAGTVIENDTRPSLSRTSDTSPRSMMLPCMSGPLTRRKRSTTWSLLRLIACSREALPETLGHSRWPGSRLACSPY